MTVERTLPRHIQKLFIAAAATNGPRMIDSWSTVFVRNANESGLIEAINTIALALDQLDSAVSASNFDETIKAQSAGNISRLRQFVTFPLLYEGGPQNLNQPDMMSTIQNFIFLEAIAGEPLNRVLPDGLVLDFQNRVTDLRNDVDELPLAPQVKAMLKESLGRIIWALGAYDLLGIEGLSRLFGSATSEIFRATPEVARSSEGKAFLKKTIGVTKLIAAAIITVGGLAQGTETISDFSETAASLLLGDDAT